MNKCITKKGWRTGLKKTLGDNVKRLSQSKHCRKDCKRELREYARHMAAVTESDEYGDCARAFFHLNFAMQSVWNALRFEAKEGK